MRSMSPRRGWTLAELLVVLVLIALLSALLLPPYFRSARHGRVERCVGNLRQLHAAHEEFVRRHPGSAPGTGKPFWLKLMKTSPPLIDPGRSELYLCPVLDHPGTEACQYLGPSGDVAAREANDPIGCDESRNHSPDGRQGGNVLLKSGDVYTGWTGFWGAAVREGKCSP